MMFLTKLLFASVAFLLGVNQVAGMRINVKEEIIAASDAQCAIRGNGRTLTKGRELGSGAEGTVYEGLENGQPAAAIKLMKKVNTTELRNLHKLTRVQSQHLLRLEKGFENVQQCCGQACVITQLIRGKDMAHIMWDNGFTTRKRAAMARKGAVSYQLLRSLILQALTAFRDTEAAGLCNYDQHLRNIMYEDGTERVVFIDFGHASESRVCPPKGPFKPEYSNDTSVQSFRSLAHLVKDAAVKQAYLALCDRMEHGLYRSASEALLSEAFADPNKQDPSEPGSFFSLIVDEDIVKQLQALKDTNSPHIGTTAPSPFSDQQPPKPKPAPVAATHTFVEQAPMQPSTDAWVQASECNVPCGATSINAQNVDKAMRGSFALSTLPLAPNQCAKCGFKPSCFKGVHAKIATFTSGGSSQSLCCRALECTR